MCKCNMKLYEIVNNIQKTNFYDSDFDEYEQEIDSIKVKNGHLLHVSETGNVISYLKTKFCPVCGERLQDKEENKESPYITKGLSNMEVKIPTEKMINFIEVIFELLKQNEIEFTKPIGYKMSFIICYNFINKYKETVLGKLYANRYYRNTSIYRTVEYDMDNFGSCGEYFYYS